MKRRSAMWTAGIAGAVGIAAAVLSACSNNSSCTQVLGPGQTLAGSYRVDSNAANVINGLQVPGITGPAVLTDSIYSVALNIPGLGTVKDSGTYHISCNTISEQSVLGSPPPPPLVGTFSVAGDTLTVRGTASGVSEVLTFLKTGP